MESLPLCSVPINAAYLDFRESKNPEWYALPKGSIVALKLPCETLYIYNFNWAFINKYIDSSIRYEDSWFILKDSGIPLHISKLILSEELFEYNYEIISGGSHV